MGCTVVFLLFLVAFKTGRREEKHGIYCVGQTWLTLAKGHVVYSFWCYFGPRLGALGHICVPKCLLGSVLEK